MIGLLFECVWWTWVYNVVANLVDSGENYVQVTVLPTHPPTICTHRPPLPTAWEVPSWRGGGRCFYPRPPPLAPGGPWGEGDVVVPLTESGPVAGWSLVG